MKTQIIRLAGFLILLCVLPGWLAPTLDAFATPLKPSPTPSSPLIAGFVLEVDRKFGYEMLRPSNWISTDLGEMRGFTPPGSVSHTDQLMLAVSNMQTVAERLADQNTIIATFHKFKQNPTLSAWASARKAFWETTGYSYELEHELPNAVVYTLKPAPGEMRLVADVVSKDQPLVIVLIGLGAFSDLEALKDQRLFADFELMVRSATAYDSVSTTHEVTAAAPGLTPSGQPGQVLPLWVERWFHHNDGTYQTWMAARWESSVYEVQRLYEKLTVPYQMPGTYTILDRTNISYDPNLTCDGVGGSYYERRINKRINPPGGSVEDDFWPYYRDSRIGRQTYHLLRYSGIGWYDCRWHQPFFP